MAVGVSEAADRPGVSHQRVLQMIPEQSLPAQRIGHSWAVDEGDIALRHGELIVHVAANVPPVSPV